MPKTVSGFSKFSKEEKLQWMLSSFFKEDASVENTLKQYWNSNEVLQDLHDDFIENTLSNFYLPFAIAPNFKINGRDYAVPMVTEESSVVAAASLVAKFWSTRGGFKASVIASEKIGQVHFMYAGDATELRDYFEKKKSDLYKVTEGITKNMRKRGGGILEIELRDKTTELANYYQLHITFETKDSMGANFINSCLEAIANEFENETISVVMSILSNYVPNCLVRAEVSCPVSDLYVENSVEFAQKFKQAIQIANIEPHRAVTHNKGVMNGVDAVILATGNDFRAIESGAHAYAAKSGSYKSLTHCEIKDEVFRFWIEIPLAVGTVGGLTGLHPLSKLSLQLLGSPSAHELMMIVAVAGLAQNFAALRALTTTGIQKGHMKMHLTNIIKQLGASSEEKQFLISYFENKTVTHNAVVEAYENMTKV
ncbi:MAG: hydroxymethylglutaryl-CoA reductase, degradative [Flavobacteriaceae bacterium]|nr:hydroxymethylglutaryl-CoA reductase, degradative [Flavobacteriaceae bacterium]